MRLTAPRKSVLALSILAFPLMLAACGEAPGSPDGAPVVRGVFTSATECAAIGVLTLDKCTAAIETAVAEHEANAPSYTSLKACEKVEGHEKCERTSTSLFRPRLMAFMIVMTDPPQSAPLYPTAKGETGFRTPGNDLVLSDDETLTFSRPALAAAELLAVKAKPAGMY